MNHHLYQEDGALFHHIIFSQHLNAENLSGLEQRQDLSKIFI